MRSIVYVDGLNLYYAALRGTAFKWLDLYGLFQDRILGPSTRLERVRYYTAPVKSSASDDRASPERQQRYLRALKAYCGDRIEIVQGSIVRTTPIRRLADPGVSDSPVTARVVQFTEKETDVNLAADLISDSWKGRCDQAVICSNDRDLVGALKAIRRDHPSILIGLVAPIRDRRYVSSHLSRYASWCKLLSHAHLASAQLPDKIPGTQLTRPDAWKKSTRGDEIAESATSQLNATHPSEIRFPPAPTHRRSA